MSLATLGGSAVTSATVSIPAWGLIWAEVDTVDPVVLTGHQTLVVADVSYSMSVVSGGVHDGKASYRLVSGVGGWGKDVAAKGYADDSGVSVSKVLTDLAAAVGESVTGAPSTRRGPHYTVPVGPAYAVLNELAPRSWYARPDGVVVIGKRPTVAYAGQGVVTHEDPALGCYDAATEIVADLVPGVTIKGSPPATDVELELNASTLVAHVRTSTRTTRRLDALRRIVLALDPGARYRGLFEYRVVSQSGERFNLQAARSASGMADLQRVPVRPFFGIRAKVTPGCLVLVAFADGDPSRPAVVAGPAVDAPGWMPTELDFGMAPRLGVARLTDAVQAGPFSGVITLASSTIKAGL